MSIESFVENALGPDKVRSVSTSHDLDRYGIPILRVLVVVDESNGPIDLKKMLNLPIALRQSSLMSDDLGYPVVSFVDLSEASVSHAAE